MVLFVVLASVIALAAVIFALQNNYPVAISLLNWRVDESLALVLLVTLLIGGIIGLLLSLSVLLRKNWRISRYQKQVASLEQQLQEQEQAAQAQTQEWQRIKLHHQHELSHLQHTVQELLGAVSATDPQTGLLHSKWLPDGVAYRLQQMAMQEAGFSSLCLYMLEVVPLDDTVEPGEGLSAVVLAAIATQLQAAALPDSWLYCDGRERFTCLTPGLDAKQANEYGESLRVAFANQPLAIDEGATVETMVSIGAAIAPSSAGMTGQALLQQAQDALELAKRRGRNRFRLVEAQ